ncbi:superoxide dismutase family protein [Mobilitalea sibirica]
MFNNSNYMNSNDNRNYNNNAYIAAIVNGGPLAPEINGIVMFEHFEGGTIVTANIYGLPEFKPAKNGQAPIGPFGFHIHENGDCTVGNTESPFEAAGDHWNPDNQPHGNHAGDLPVLFSNNGYSYMSFYTNRFQPEEVIGKAVIIHQNPDDYRTQPAGDAGSRLACGVIDYVEEMYQ